MTQQDADLIAARILVVDDQAANVELLARMLADAGYTAVSTTTNPRDVCPLHRSAPFDLIRLDLQMPDMDGFEVMEQLKRIEPLGYLPVLVVTAQPSAKFGGVGTVRLRSTSQVVTALGRITKLCLS